MFRHGGPECRNLSSVKMKLLKLIFLVCCGSIERGPCLAYVPSWYYDPSTHSCKFFVYGGCGGNENRFPPQLKRCQDDCCHRDIDKSGSCIAPPERGSCTANLLKWYFQPTTRTCVPFIYGGCGGNANNYGSWQECQLTCNHNDWIPVPLETKLID